MKLKRILGRLEELLSAKKRDRRKQVDELESLLRQLKRKGRKLAHELEAIDGDEERAELGAKLEIVRAQRRKGLAALKALRKS